MYKGTHQVSNNNINCTLHKYDPRKILVIDDDKVSRIVAKAMLEKRNGTVEVAGSYLEALHMLSNESFDVIFLDIHLPEPNGFEIASNIRNGITGERNKRSAIVAYTGNSSEEDQKIYLKAGFSGCIEKPFSGDELDILYENLKMK